MSVPGESHPRCVEVDQVPGDHGALGALQPLQAHDAEVLVSQVDVEEVHLLEHLGHAGIPPRLGQDP